MFKRSRPFVGIAIALVLGILLARQFGTMAFYISIIAIPLTAAMYYLSRKDLSGKWELPFRMFFFLSLSGIGAGLYCTANLLPSNHVSNFIGQSARVEGIAQGDSRNTPFGQKVILECTAPYSGKLMLYFDVARPITAHTHIKVDARIKALSTKNPGYANYLRNQGILATASAKGSLQQNGKTNSWMADISNIREYASQKIENAVPGSELAGLSKAMLLGDKSQLDSETKSDFSAAGLSHVLAISGMHVGIIFFILNMILGFLAYRTSHRKIRTLLVLSFLVLYMLLTGCSPAVCRTVLMISLMQLGTIFFQQADSMNLLGFAAFILLLIDPLLAFNVGFQLSFAAVSGILLLGPAIAQRIETAFPMAGKSLFYSEYKLSGALSVCIAAQLATAPLIWIYFGQFPTWFLLSNLMILPFVSLSVGLGFCALLLCWMPVVGETLFGMQDFVLAVVVWLSSVIAELPAAVVTSLSFKDVGFSTLFIMLHLGLGMLYWREIRSWIQRPGKFVLPGFQILQKRSPAFASVGMMMVMAVVGVV